MRGDQPKVEKFNALFEEFTPHAWGSTQVNDRFIESTSIYPACAGINPHLGQIVLICLHLPRMRGDQPQPIVAYTTFKDLPRVCGDQPMQILGDGFVLKFTPRARGSTTKEQKRMRWPIIYPACAGINLSDCPICGCRIHLPRVRGDQPREGVAFEQVFQFTPQARGSPFCAQKAKNRK